jgi:flagellar motor switch protein FliM
MSRDHVRTMQIAQEAIARGFTTVLAGSLRAVTQVSIGDIEQCTYDEYIRSVPNPTLLTMLSLNTRHVAAILEIPLKVAYAATELMLGGPGGDIQPTRQMTDLELMLMRDLVDGLNPVLKSSCEPIMKIEPAIVAQESNPQFAQLSAPSEMVILISFDIKLEAVTDVIRLCIPFAHLQPHLELLASQQLAATSGSSDGVDRARLHEHVSGSSIEVSATFRRSVATSRQLIALRIGDVIMIDHPLAMPLVLEVEGIEIADVLIGRVNRNLALQTYDSVPAGRRRRRGRMSVVRPDASH